MPASARALFNSVVEANRTTECGAPRAGSAGGSVQSGRAKSRRRPSFVLRQQQNLLDSAAVRIPRKGEEKRDEHARDQHRKRPKLLWAAIVVLGAVSFGIVALSRG